MEEQAVVAAEEDQKMTREEIKRRMDEGDRDIINQVISGDLVAKEDMPAPAIDGAVSEESKQEGVAAPSDVDESNSDSEEIKEDPREEYRKIIEKQKEEEIRLERQRLKEEALRAKVDYEKKLKEEAKAREELEKELQELKQKSVKTQQEVVEDIEEEDEEYVSGYAKRTRKKIEELEQKLQSASPENNDLLKELKQFYEEVRNKEEEREKQEKKRREEEQQEKQLQAIYNSVRSFQQNYPELQTKKDIQEIDKEWNRFQNDILTLTSAKNKAELHYYIDDYINGGKTKQLAEKAGVPFVEDFDKYSIIAELIDLKNGQKLDRKTGKFMTITDDLGHPVRYRSVDEAYRVSHYYDELNKARISAYRDVQNKLSTIDNSPKSIPVDKTASFNSDISKEQQKELVNFDVNRFRQDAEYAALVTKVYNGMGLKVPAIR